MPSKSALPNIKSVTEKEKHLPLTEKLRLMDTEIESLRKYCVGNGISSSELEIVAKPIFTVCLRAKFKFWAKLSLLFLFLASLVFCLTYCFNLTKHIATVGRFMIIKLLPFWDWTNLYYKECLISNPYYEKNKLHLEDCQSCEPIDAMEHLTNSSQSEITEDYFKNDIPVIVLDAMESWTVMNEEYTINNITQIYLSHNDVNNFLPCTFSTNIRTRGDSYFKNFLKKVDLKETKKWFAHWENCDKQASKVIRSLYERPYFLSPIIDISGPNWVFLSSTYNSRTYKKVPVVSEIMLIAQVRGTNKIRLIPKEPCSTICARLTDTLYEGEILLFTDVMWTFEYMPGEVDENIALAIGAFWED